MCVDADYFLVYLVTKSRFLFKLKSSLTPALNIIIKRAKNPSELAPAEATHLHTYTHTHTRIEKTHTHTRTVTCSRHQSPLKFNPQIRATLTRRFPDSSSSQRRSRSSDSDFDFDAAFWQRQSTHTSNALTPIHAHTRTHTHLERAALRVHHTLP